MSKPSTKTTHSTQTTAKARNYVKTKRHTTLYDAVAGRVSSTGFISPNPRISAHRDTPSSSTVAVPPEEVLFRREGAPIRYEEDEFYWADRNLTEKQKLPESDLLKAIHAYASDFYGRAVKWKGNVDFESLDETALLAVGMLMEEMAREVLGETGDLAFVEGEDDEVVGAEERVHPEEAASSREERPRSSAVASEVSLEATKSDNGNSGADMRRRKRRKTRHDDNSGG